MQVRCGPTAAIFQVGGNGSFNGLIVTNGATVADVNGIIGNVQASLANEVVVTGTNFLVDELGESLCGACRAALA